MADITHRPFSVNYSGLANQTGVASVILVCSISWLEYAKRKRRGRGRSSPPGNGLGSVETWQFGYLYQGRCWARKPSPPSPNARWPLAWVPQVITFPEPELNKLRGIDATLYTRWMRGCMWWAVLQSFTTVPILLPIHIKFADSTYAPRSMQRASIAALVATTEGKSLLWIHCILLFWVTFTWMATLLWVCRGAFEYRAANIAAAAARVEEDERSKKESQYHPHPHPQYPFHSPQSIEEELWNRGMRLRTVMVTNIPYQLRSEHELKEYFQYYLSRPLEKPAMGLTSTTQPGFFNKTMAFLFNRAKRVPNKVQTMLFTRQDAEGPGLEETIDKDTSEPPVIDRVMVVRKMTELASLLRRREDVLQKLEVAHIKLATNALQAVKRAMSQRTPQPRPSPRRPSSQISLSRIARSAPERDLERGAEDDNETIEGEDRNDLLIRVLGPFVDQFDLHTSSSKEVDITGDAVHPGRSPHSSSETTVWDALFSLPRSTLEAYQPLIRLSSLFRGKTVPSIDYYSAKLNLLTSLVTEHRSRAIADYDPVSTAFVTFSDPADARKACKYLAVHPENPLACLASMAPSYEELDWTRVMKSSYRTEFLKDWIVNIGVWAFSIFWLLPVASILGLVSIENIQAYWPALSRYLSKHPKAQTILSTFIPTLLVSLLAITIPLLLLLIAKKAHTISTLSALHDRIMIRYYKWLILNVVVFFCAGTAFLQTLLIKFSSVTTQSVLKIIAQSYPVAGPFYVGWLILNTGLHGGFELSLFGLPLIMYPKTRRQITPRGRAVGIRPRTFNYYYWLPNHLVIIHVLLLFSLLNPLVIPFGMLYFAVDRVVIKNQLLHVYAKNYEQNGQHLLIRMVRYSLDGLMLSQSVFLAYMVFLFKYVNVGLSAVLIFFTAVVKIFMTRLYRAKFEEDDIQEATVLCSSGLPPSNFTDPTSGTVRDDQSRPVTPNGADGIVPSSSAALWTWKMPGRISFSYSSIPARNRLVGGPPNPFHTQHSLAHVGSLEPAAEIRPAMTNRTRSFPTMNSGIPATEDPHSDAAVSVRSEHVSHALVTRHPPHPAWDDESRINHPYDNPYYVRSIGNFLWLPRNPVGVLDLDDTVNVHKSLTSDPGVGHIGPWHENAETASALGLSMYSDVTSIREEEDYEPLPLTASPEQASTPVAGPSSPQAQIGLTGPSPPQAPVGLTGQEPIDLPPGIARRVASQGRLADVEEAETIKRKASSIRPQSARRRSSHEQTPATPSRAQTYFPGTASTSSSRGAGATLGLGRPSTLAGHAPGMRSFSSASAQSASRHLETYRRQSLAQSQRSNRHPRTSASFARTSEFGSIRRGTGSQPILSEASLTRSMTRSMSRHFGADASASKLSQGMHGGGVSTHEAVLNEVIVEEAEAADDRERQEVEEETRAAQPKPWWQAWMFQNVEK